MTKLTKRDFNPPSSATSIPPSVTRPLRVLASGTLFLTHTLSIPTFPTEAGVIRAQSTFTSRGGHAPNVLSALAQFRGTRGVADAMLVAPLAGNDDGKMIIAKMEAEGISTRFCKVWDGVNVPAAWVLHSDETDSRTVINHNPLPDITHEEFISLLGPLLAPENYGFPDPSSPSVIANPNNALPSPTLGQFPSPSIIVPNNPAPFDWLHFEGRSVKTTLTNMASIDGHARERKWRSHCVFSLEVGRKGRQGVEALIPHADVIFLNKQYALSQSANYTSPRAFLLSLTSVARPHALLVVQWGTAGAALLSLPTREYFQASPWVDEPKSTSKMKKAAAPKNGVVESVRSGSHFYAGEHESRSTLWSSCGSSIDEGDADGDNDNDSQGTEVAREDQETGTEELDEVGAQDAFVAGMIYALSRRILPGEPYTSVSYSVLKEGARAEVERGRWRLEECLRFASELSGRKARRRGYAGLAQEMTRAGWFDV